MPMLSLSLTGKLQVEMEFVQSLANPNYLHFLAQRGFMKDPCFVNYLNYLTYWKVGEIQRKKTWCHHWSPLFSGACLCVLSQVSCLPSLPRAVAARNFQEGDRIRSMRKIP